MARSCYPPSIAHATSPGHALIYEPRKDLCHALVGGGVLHRNAKRVPTEPGPHPGSVPQKQSVRAAPVPDRRRILTFLRQMTENEIRRARNHFPSERTQQRTQLRAQEMRLTVPLGVITFI